MHAAIRKLLVAGLMLLSSATGRLRADEQPASPASQATKPESTEPRDENVLAEFEVAKNGDYLLLPVTIQGKTYSFLVDTGAMVNVFALELRPLLGAPLDAVTVSTLGQGITAQRFDSPECSVGQLPVSRDASVVCMDMSWLSKSVGNKVYGILGPEFLKQHIVQIDFDAGKITFLRELPVAPGTRVSMLYRQGMHPFVMARLVGIGPVLFNVDTGASGSVIVDGRLFDRLKQSKTLTLRRSVNAETPAGARQAQSGLLLNDLQLQGWRHPQMHVHSARVSCLGLAYWTRYRLILDFRKQALYLKPSRQFNTPDREDCSGMRLARNGGKIVVRQILKSSPAAEAKFRVGDIILSINGMSIDKYSLFEIAGLLAIDKGTIRIQTERDGHVYESQLRLRDYRAEISIAQ